MDSVKHAAAAFENLEHQSAEFFQFLDNVAKIGTELQQSGVVDYRENGHHEQGERSMDVAYVRLPPAERRAAEEHIRTLISSRHGIPRNSRQIDLRIRRLQRAVRRYDRRLTQQQRADLRCVVKLLKLATGPVAPRWHQRWASRCLAPMPRRIPTQSPVHGVAQHRWQEYSARRAVGAGTGHDNGGGGGDDGPADATDQYTPLPSLDHTPLSPAALLNQIHRLRASVTHLGDTDEAWALAERIAAFEIEGLRRGVLR